MGTKSSKKPKPDSRVEQNVYVDSAEIFYCNQDIAGNGESILRRNEILIRGTTLEECYAYFKKVKND